MKTLMVVLSAITLFSQTAKSQTLQTSKFYIGARHVVLVSFNENEVAQRSIASNEDGKRVQKAVTALYFRALNSDADSLDIDCDRANK